LTAAAGYRAMEIARRHGRKVIFDIDYRPVLWGWRAMGWAKNRFVDSAEVTRRLQAILPGCDVVVGTEEEIPPQCCDRTVLRRRRGFLPPCPPPHRSRAKWLAKRRVTSALSTKRFSPNPWPASPQRTGR